MKATPATNLSAVARARRENLIGVARAMLQPARFTALFDAARARALGRGANKFEGTSYSPRPQKIAG